MDDKKQKDLDDAGMLFLWKVKEASQGYRKSVKKLFGKSFATSTLQAFDEAMDNFTSEYVNDVNTVFAAFSENMEQLVEPIVKPESPENPQPLYVINEPEGLSDIHEIKQEQHLNSDVEEEEEERATAAEKENTQETETMEQNETIEREDEQAMLLLENEIEETASQQIKQEAATDIQQLKQEIMQDHDQVTYEHVEGMELSLEDQKQPPTEDAWSESAEGHIKGEAEVEAGKEPVITASEEIETPNETELIADQTTSDSLTQLHGEQGMEIIEAHPEPTTDIILEGDPATTAFQQSAQVILNSEQEISTGTAVQQVLQQSVLPGLPEQVEMEAVDGDGRNIILEATEGAGIQYVTEQITNEHNQEETVQYIVSDDPAVQQQIEHIEFADDPSGSGERVIYITMAGDVAEAAGGGEGGQCVEYVTTEVDGEFASALGLADGQTTLPVQVANAAEEGSFIVKYVDEFNAAQAAVENVDPALYEATSRRGRPRKADTIKKKSEQARMDIINKICMVKPENGEENTTEDEDQPRDLDKAALLDETETVNNIAFTIAPKPLPNRKRKALLAGSGGAGFKCEICGDILFHQAALTKHKNIMHPDKADYACVVCYEPCGSLKRLRRHFFRAHMKGRFCICLICNRKFKTHECFKAHLGSCTFQPEDLGYERPIIPEKEIKGADLPIKCKFCQQGFISQGTLTRHIVAKHLKYTKGAPNSCDLCEKAFLDEFSLFKHTSTARHRRRMRETYGDNMEEEDNDSLNDSEDTRTTRSHGFTNIASPPVRVKRGKTKNEKRFVCYICGREFGRNSSLYIHVRAHEKSFACDICGHRVTTAQKLVVHRRIHTGETPFICHQCGKCFRGKDHLSHHRKTMHNNVVFKCPDCGGIFKHERNLCAHIQKKHGKEAYKRFRGSGVKPAVPAAHAQMYL